jgi:hypothetical protein
VSDLLQPGGATLGEWGDDDIRGAWLEGQSMFFTFFCKYHFKKGVEFTGVGGAGRLVHVCHSKNLLLLKLLLLRWCQSLIASIFYSPTDTSLAYIIHYGHLTI